MDGSRLRLTVLGELTALVDGVRADLGGRLQRAVLAQLIVARGQVVPAEQLADAVWGDGLRSNSAAALQSYVSHLRRRLAPGADAGARGDVLVRSGPGYALRLPPDAVDAWRFDALLQQASRLPEAEAVPLLEEALQLWSGPAYADYAGEPWVEAEVARLTGLRDVARERLAEGRLATGDAALIVPELEGLTREQPLREERWRLLVLALYRARRQADALAALRRARQILADELGVDPGPELRALESEVLQQSPALELPVQRVAPVVPAGPAAAPATVELLGREREVSVLRGAIADAARSTSAVLLVEGGAGIGKSRLLTEACTVASGQGLRVLSARGSQLERSYGFGVVRQLFEPCLVDPAARERRLTGAAGSARGVFDDAVGDRADGSFAVLHGLYWLTVGISAEAPLLLAVDDVQWCDPGSLRFLNYLVRRLDGLPVLVVATLRTGEQHEDEDLIAELALDAATTPLRPAPLDVREVGQLVELRLGEPAPAFVAACHSMTGGNPLLLRQLLRALEAEGVKPDVGHVDTVRAVGSRAISSLVLMRLRRMRQPVAAAARAVAVLGDGADLPQVAALAGLPEQECASALSVLSRAEVLRDDVRPAFVHPLVRDAVYDDVPAAERALQHERAARVLQDAGAPPERVAAHLVLAPRRGNPATVAVLRSAARAAAERGAPESATALLRRALDEPASGQERLDVLLQLGLWEALLDGPAGAERLGQAYPLIEDPDVRADTAVVLARTHAFTSPGAVATAFARDAAAQLPAGRDDTRQALVALQRISGFMHSLDPSEYRTGPEPEVAGTGDGARMLAAALAWEHMLAGEDRQRAVGLARFALEQDRLIRADSGLFWVIAALVRLLAEDDIGDFWDRARVQAHRTGAVFAATSANLWRGWHEWLRGELHEALQSLADSREQQRMWGGTIGYSYIAAFTTGIHLDRGDLAAARATVDDAAGQQVGGEGTRLYQEMSARLLLDEGRCDEALHVVEAAVEPLGIVNPAWAPWRGLRARALHGLGRTEEALELVDEQVRLLRRWGAPTWLGASLRLRGELAGSDTGALREAEQLLSGSEAAVELARARVSLGSAAGVGDDEAVPLLEAAAAAAAASGAVGVLDGALAALQERGRRPDVCVTAAGPTRTERRVLDLLAEGLDDRQVAQRLLMTPGTVRTIVQRAAAHAQE